METRLDATNRIIKIGDSVVYSDTARETSSLKQGEISGFTAKKVKLLVVNASWRIARGEDHLVEILKFPEQIAKID